MITLYFAKWVVPVAAPPIENGALGVSEGRIVAVGPAAQVARDCEGQQVERRELPDCILCPGFINTHTHLELTLLRGSVEDLPLIGWIKGVVAKKKRLSRDAILASARWGVLDAVRSGVTTVGEIVDHGESVQAISEGGLRAVAFQEIYDLHQEPLGGGLSRLEALLGSHRKYVSDRIALGVSPHSPATVSRPLFEKLAESSLVEGRRLAIHAAESRDEVELLEKGSGRMAALFRSFGALIDSPRMTPVKYLASLGVLDARPLLIHVVHVTEEELDFIASSGSAVAHCPKSNAKLGNGIAPVSRMMASGVPVGLGTDSMASNNACDMLEEARFALLMQRATADSAMDFGAGCALELATLGGARALELDRETGSLEIGKRADFVAISLREPGMIPTTSPEAALIFSGSARDVQLVAVNGEVLYDHGRFTRWDEEQLRREVLEAACQLR